MPQHPDRRPGPAAAALVFIALVTMPAVTPAAGVIRRGDSGCAGVGLTFDMCPVRGTVGMDEGVIDLLEERRIHATFFVSGSWVDRHPADFRRLLAVPFFEIGTHGETHTSLPGLSRQRQRHEIFAPVARVAAQYGRELKLFRPPFGDYSPETLQLADSLGLTFVLWSVASGDADPKLSADRIERALQQRVRGGSIIVFHANGRGRHTREIVDETATRLDRQGLSAMTLSELMSCPLEPRASSRLPSPAAPTRGF